MKCWQPWSSPRQPDCLGDDQGCQHFMSMIIIGAICSTNTIWIASNPLASMLKSTTQQLPGYAKTPRPWFNIKMSSYQYKKSHCGDKTVVRSSFLHNGICYILVRCHLYIELGLCLFETHWFRQELVNAFCDAGPVNIWQELVSPKFTCPSDL